MKAMKSLILQAIALSVGTTGLVASAGAQAECPPRPKLKIDTHTLDYTEHRAICVRPNGVFRIKLVAQGSFVIDPDKIDVKEKAGPGTIEKVGINPDTLVMRVKVTGYPSNTEAAFIIMVEDVGELDPRVRINTNYLALTPEMELMDDYTLDNFGISLLQLNVIDQYFQDEFGTSITEVSRTFGEYNEGE